jgi:hypothetical protein
MTMIRMMMAIGIRSNVIDNFLRIYNGKVNHSGTAIKIQVTPGVDGKVAILATSNNNNINQSFNQRWKSIFKLQFILWPMIILMQPVILRHQIPRPVLLLLPLLRAILHPVWSHLF